MLRMLLNYCITVTLRFAFSFCWLISIIFEQIPMWKCLSFFLSNLTHKLRERNNRFVHKIFSNELNSRYFWHIFCCCIWCKGKKDFIFPANAFNATESVCNAIAAPQHKTHTHTTIIIYASVFLELEHL